MYVAGCGYRHRMAGGGGARSAKSSMAAKSAMAGGNIFSQRRWLQLYLRHAGAGIRIMLNS